MHSAMFFRAMEHQAEALKFLKQVHLQQMPSDNRSVGSREDDKGVCEKEKQVTADLDSSIPTNVVTDYCTRSREKGDPLARHSVRTIAERARESIFTRLTEIASQVISVEEDICRSSSEDQRLSLHLKDSIELRNICARMSTSPACRQSERDLRELGHCLKCIVDSLLCCLCNNDCLWVSPATRRLREIYTTFPDI
ncbi:hypothetical protein MATL_G00176580 [Megalops atlanticus]|uniref:Uncharacterized protein n=1 Tax=Megalops atlanticus TaxID=7932 RepID=A0A9D3PRE6_MEGAT|nr:hypothetical protein MATL_G00176580 [Megalops atlanticus]